MTGAPLLDVRGLNVAYEIGGEVVSVVIDVDLSIGPGESLGLAGESGCGKTTTALACLGLLPRNARTGGSIIFRDVEVLTAKPGRLRAIRWAGISMVFQGAMNALNPVKRIGDQVVEAIRLHDPDGAKNAATRAGDLLGAVGISPKRFDDYPHEFSGGMRQRVMIAMALACRPPLVIADEPTTALDVMIQAQIISLLADLRQDFGIALMLITHDLSVIAQVCDRVAIMYAGKVVEEGSSDDVLRHPKHPYPEALVAAFPRVGDPSSRGVPLGLPGDPPHPGDRPSGCPFHPRCPYRFEPCDDIEPPLVAYEHGWRAACHKVELESRTGAAGVRERA